MDYTLEDVFDLSNSLGENTNNYRLAYTFNYPRTAKFKQMDKEHQENLYKFIIDRVKLHLMHDFKIKEDRYYYEEAGGHYHVHGYMDLQTNTNGSMLGALESISRMLEYDNIIPVTKSRCNSFAKCDIGQYAEHCSLYCPAYCLKMNKDKSPVWENYCAKNAR